MNRRWAVLRVDYAFSVEIPLLLALYLHDLPIIPHLPILFGFFFLAMAGNVINDLIDRQDPRETAAIERLHSFRTKEILVIILALISLGLSLFMPVFLRQPWIVALLAGAIGMVLLYCVLKHIPILNDFLLVGSHILIPYLIIRVYNWIPGTPIQFGIAESMSVITLIFIGITGQLVHETIDGEALHQFSLRAQQITILLCATCSLLVGLTTIIWYHYLIFWPFVIIPLGIFYQYRHPVRPPASLKDLGILLGNFGFIYLVLLLILQENAII